MSSEKLSIALKFLNTWLEYRYKVNDWPGLTVAVSHKGQLLFNNSYGYANIEKGEKLTPNHIFRIASHSKTFTATAIMQLSEQGKLKIDDSAATYIPWLKTHPDKRFQKVTIKDLLSHKAGVIRDGLDADFWILNKPFMTVEEFKIEVLKSNLVLNPGKKMKYSNFGYTLLGLVIENASNTPYNEYVTKYIVKPLNLKNTGPEYASQVKEKLVMGYSRKDGKTRLPIATSIDTKIMSPATGFYSTTEDLCTYFQAQFVGSGKLLSDSSKALMQKGHAKILKDNIEKEYGLGFIHYKMGSRKFFGHGGGFPGHNTITICDPKDELIVCVLLPAINGAAMHFAKGIVSIIDHFEKQYKATTKDLTKFEGIFENIFAVTQIISMGEKLEAIDPNSFEPFVNVEHLKQLDEKTLRVGSTNSFYSEGENVQYTFDSKQIVVSINYAGMTMLPTQLIISSN